MQYAKLLFVFVISMFLIGCSSMSFIPPQYSLATMEYVNNSTDAIADKTTEEVISRFTTVMDSVLSVERNKLDSLAEKLESQQGDVEKIMSSMEEVDQRAQSIKDYFAKMRKDLSRTKQELNDSLDAISSQLGNLENIDSLLSCNILKIDEVIKGLEQANVRFNQLTDSMKSRIEILPKEILLNLRTAIEEYYREGTLDTLK